MGICNPYQLQLIRDQITLPLILDAGIGTASDAAIAMELGIDGILVNTAIAQAARPVLMAEAMALACRAGRKAYLAGRISRKRYGEPSSTMEGLLSCRSY